MRHSKNVEHVWGAALLILVPFLCALVLVSCMGLDYVSTKSGQKTSDGENSDVAYGLQVIETRISIEGDTIGGFSQKLNDALADPSVATLIIAGERIFDTASNLELDIPEGKTVKWRAVLEAPAGGRGSGSTVGRYDGVVRVKGAGTFILEGESSIVATSGSALVVEPEASVKVIISDNAQVKSVYSSAIHLEGPDSTIVMNGGVVFAYGDVVLGVDRVIDAVDHSQISFGEGVAVAWSGFRDTTSYEAVSSADLIWLPDDNDVRVFWEASSEKDSGLGSIWYKKNENEGKIVVDDVRVVPVELTIKADDATIRVGEELPNSWGYQVLGLVEGVDESTVFLTTPTANCTLDNSRNPCVWPISVSEGVTTDNYRVVSTTDGVLRVEATFGVDSDSGQTDEIAQAAISNNKPRVSAQETWVVTALIAIAICAIVFTPRNNVWQL